MVGFHLTGYDSHGVVVLEQFVNGTISEGQTCDRLRQCPVLARAVIRFAADVEVDPADPDREVLMIHTFIRSPWVVVDALAGLAGGQGLDLAIELPQQSSPLMVSINAFWTAWVGTTLRHGGTEGPLRVQLFSV